MNPLRWFRKSTSSTNTRALGHRAERLARRHLRRQGLQILQANYQCPLGEADLVACDDNVLIFVEVKARVDDPDGAVEAIGPAKQARLGRIAQCYLNEIGKPDHPVRFDAVTVVIPQAGRPVIKHIPHAFRL